MAQFYYKAKQGPSKVVDGTFEADTKESAIGKIVQMGLVPVEISESVPRPKKEDRKKHTGMHWDFSKAVKLPDLVQFTRQMSDLMGASVPILRSLQITGDQTSNLYLKETIEAMNLVVRDGGSLSEALTRYPKIFSPLYVNMVKTGEVAGQLELVLNRLADYLEKEQDTRNKIRSSLAYPLFILGVGVITVLILLTFVIPRLSLMFEDLDQALPLPTVILMNMSGFLARWWWLLLLVVGGAVFFFKEWLRSPQGRIRFDLFVLKLPFIGNFIKIVEIGRFARTLGTLIESGVVITSALRAVWAIIENSILREEVKRIAEDVAAGSSLKIALKKGSFFPNMAVNMIAVGEESGRLEKGLYKIAESYERQADETSKTILSLLGPIFLVFIVSMVGMVVIAMLLPIFKMNLLIK